MPDGCGGRRDGTSGANEAEGVGADRETALGTGVCRDAEPPDGPRRWTSNSSSARSVDLGLIRAEEFERFVAGALGQVPAWPGPWSAPAS